MGKSRGGTITGIVGINNTGKSVIAAKIIEVFNRKRDLIENNGKKYPPNYNKLIAFDPQERFKHLMRAGDLTLRTGNKDWEKGILKYRDSLIVFDDVKQLMRGQTLNDEFLDILGWRVEHGLDMIFIVHHPKFFPPSLSSYMNRYYFFKFNGNHKQIAERLGGEEDEIINCKRLLDLEFKKYTPQQYSAKYPNFPFIEHNIDTNESFKINF